MIAFVSFGIIIFTVQMKVLTSFFAVFLHFTVGAQSYIDSGIRHYKAKEFKEALVDFKEAENLKVMFTSSAVGKLQYYRGLTIWELNRGNDEIGEEEVNQILTDFHKAEKLDSSRSEAIELVIDQLYDLVYESSNSIGKKAGKEKSIDAKSQLLSKYVDRLLLCESVKKSEAVELNLAKAYHDFGDLYFQRAEDIIDVQIAEEKYKMAIDYYEIARYNDPYSKEIISALLTLSERMDDPERVKEYTKLLELAGG